MRIIVITSIFLFLFSKSYCQFNGGYVPIKGFVPDTTTAIKIAEAVWLPIYGKKIYDELPFKAVLIGDTVWNVYGYLPPSSKTVNAKGDTLFTIVSGGVANIFIRKYDGKILEVFHGK
jgi:NTF2 fold immunity protein of polymorphic toxin system component